MYYKEYIILAFLTILWCVIHSGMISLKFSGFMKRKFGKLYKFYRLIYNIFAIVTFVLLSYYETGARSYVIFEITGGWSILRYSLAICSLALFIFGGRNYDMMQFAGIRQIRRGDTPIVLSDNNDFNVSGILAYIRHPWYTASILLLWSYFDIMYLSTLISSGVFTFYVIIGAMLEERKLIKEFGDTYREYQKKVSMLFPFKSAALLFKSSNKRNVGRN